jgi:hypothetical protein
MKQTLAVSILAVVLFLVLALGRSPLPPAPAQEGGPADKGKGKPSAALELRAEIKKLQEIVPDQAAVMTHVGYHWSNLWFALEQENWPLADFYLSETRNNIKWAVRTKPFRKSSAGLVVDLGAIAEALDNTQLKQLREAIAAKDRKRSVKLYDEAMVGCYACHKASEKLYLIPQRPSAPEVRVLNFDPRAKGPE